MVPFTASSSGGASDASIAYNRERVKQKLMNARNRK
jgi:hypothetical protein